MTFPQTVAQLSIGVLLAGFGADILEAIDAIIPHMVRQMPRAIVFP